MHEREGLRYALHNDAVDVLLGYVVAPIKKGKRISPGWEMHLNFNSGRKSIKLIEAFFAKGEVSRTLRDLIAIVDSGWMVPRSDLVFVDVRTRKQLPLESSDRASLNQARRMPATEAHVDSRLSDNKDGSITLASVLRKVIQ